MPEIVIVDSKGVEHVFPSGFDPKKAAAIVKRQTAEPPNMNAKGGDTIFGEDPNAPSMFSKIMDTLGHGAQPESVGDFLSLILPTSMGMKANPSNAITQNAGPAAGRILQSTGGAIRKAGELSTPASVPIAMTDAIARGRPGEAITIAAAPYAARGVGSAMEGVGGFLRRPGSMMKLEFPEVKLGEVVDPTLPKGVSEGVFHEVPPTPKPALPPARSTQMPAASPSTELEEKLLSEAEAQGRQMAQDVPWNGDPVEDALDRAANRRQEAFTNRVNGSTEPESVIDYTDGGLEGTGKAQPEEIGEVGEPPTAEAQEVTMKNGEPDPNDMLNALGGGSSPEEVIQNAGIPLGKPRVISWKSGHGPSDELIEKTRAEEGSKATASRLGITQKQVVARTSDGPRQLPTAVQDRIRGNMENMTLEQKLDYLQNAPNGLSEAFIKSILEGQ